MEILETGNLRRIGYEKTDDVRAITLFQGIYGVGRYLPYSFMNFGLVHDPNASLQAVIPPLNGSQVVVER